ncbi:Piso0_005331 [Millerozyma farinosa CBS 7064]|uniref:allantoicase n=1 Tax=Pichia sorbitophila (strain ATCC MYA-4447 / BCRC 22081 / CBS 7064 / NBRC 10061 / NRRL Y-12695) TaxID=559304 RepID=G8Y1W5_PICSO|nr:Piso0_005331 [Millerozyma farinosa CBS 7064]
MVVKVLEEQFKKDVVYKYTDVIGEKVGGRVVKLSDEWFAAAENLIKPKAPIRDATRFTHAGAWYDGWETRRHNTAEADFVIIRMGVSSAKLIGCEVDTAFFNGNHAPHISVEAVHLDDDNEIETLPESQWETVIDKVECGPSQKHFFVRDGLTSSSYTHVRLRMYPDGGIARFRLYGSVIPIYPKNVATVLDMASVKNGGVAIRVSDQHFGSADNLVLPGRGHDMSDGWETKRSREPGHVDWVVIRLGALTKISQIVVDTAHFRGNFPQKVNVKAIRKSSDEEVPAHDSKEWELLVPDSKTGPHAEHQYDVSSGNAYSHVLLTIIPDGGVKRVRVFGNIVPH